MITLFKDEAFAVKHAPKQEANETCFRMLKVYKQCHAAEAI